MLADEPMMQDRVEKIGPKCPLCDTEPSSCTIVCVIVYDQNDAQLFVNILIIHFWTQFKFFGTLF